MRSRQKAILLLTIVLTFSALCFIVLRHGSPTNKASAQDSRTGPKMRQISDAPEEIRARMTSESISKLFLDKQISFDESKLAPESSARSQAFHIRLDSGVPSSLERQLSTDETATPFLRVISESTVRGTPIARQRSFELSALQIAIFAVNDAKQILWWELQPDPRIVRAETSDEQGNLEGRTLFRTAADVLFTLPADEDIKAVYVYSPSWDGNSYSMELIGTVRLRSDRNGK